MISSRCFRKIEPRRGALFVWLALCLAVIIGVLALGLDGGRLMNERRRAQSAADVAALAASASLYRNAVRDEGLDPEGSARAAAEASASSNGYTADENTTITVNIPPVSGNFKDKPGHVEVLIQRKITGSFCRHFTTDGLAVNVRAVGRGRPKYLGVMVLKASGDNAMDVTANGIIDIKKGSIYVASDSNTALNVSNTSTINVESVEIVGDAKVGGDINGAFNPGIPPTTDPLSKLPAPNLADYTLRSPSTLKISDTVVLKPGIYQGGMELSGQANVTFEPGIYILDGGGIKLTGDASMTAKEVMLYNTGGGSAEAIKLTGQGAVTITPPTTGTYAGIAIFQDRSVTKRLELEGNGNLNVFGTVYAPSAQIKLSGNGTTNTVGGAYICSTLDVGGNGTFTFDPLKLQTGAPDVHAVE